MRIILKFTSYSRLDRNHNYSFNTSITNKDTKQFGVISQDIVFHKFSLKPNLIKRWQKNQGEILGYNLPS